MIKKYKLLSQLRDFTENYILFFWNWWNSCWLLQEEISYREAFFCPSTHQCCRHFFSTSAALLYA